MLPPDPDCGHDHARGEKVVGHEHARREASGLGLGLGLGERT